MSNKFEQYNLNKTQQGPKEELVGKMNEEDNPELMDTLISLRDVIRSWKEDNKNIFRE